MSQSRDSVLVTMHRFQLRLLLIGLALCFLVSARHMTLGVKSACIVGASYAATLLGSFKTIETLAEGLDPGVKNILLLVMMLFLTVGFPSIVRWSVKDLFEETKKHV